MAQADWWWCHKCQGLFFAGNPGSVCPAGGGHEKPADGISYVLVTQTKWTDQSLMSGSGSGPGAVSTGDIIGLYAEANFAGAVALIARAHGKGPTAVQAAVDPDPAGRAVVASSDDGIGVHGSTTSGSGVVGQSKSGRGVWGRTESFMATVGDADTGTGVWGHSKSGPGVHAESDSGRGIEARGNPAGHFDGNVDVTGNVTAHDVVLSGGDCAEEFAVRDTASVDAGTVLVIDDDGLLARSERPYDSRVAGVVSGAGDLHPGVVLGRVPGGPARLAVALVGRVFCKVDATDGPVAVGDLLTTARRPGHAMRVADPARAFGSVLGKALRPLPAGTGLVPILVGLQ
jgi:hypothetical protein